MSLRLANHDSRKIYSIMMAKSVSLPKLSASTQLIATLGVSFYAANCYTSDPVQHVKRFNLKKKNQNIGHVIFLETNIYPKLIPTFSTTFIDCINSN